MSGNVFTRAGDSHWYTAEGNPCHTQPDGKKTTLRHARKQNLLPSVTSVLSIIPKQAIEDWRVQQAVIATMHCMSESNAAYHTVAEMMELVSEKLETNTGAGRRFGSEMHEIAEYINNEGQLPPAMSPLSTKHSLHAAKYLVWLKGCGVATSRTEMSIVGRCPKAYGGRIDLLIYTNDGKIRLVDIKTQDTKGKSPRIYPEWSYQLAAYRNALYQSSQITDIECVSLVISSNDGEITEHAWPEQDIVEGLDIFRKAYDLWSAIRGYAPDVKSSEPVKLKLL